MRACAVFLIPLLIAGGARADAIKVGEALPLLPDGPGKGLQATPAVAYGRDAYLVVWREGWHGKGGSARIFAARVSKDGKVLDPRGIEVAPTGRGVQESPRVAFAGDTYLVVWQDFRNGKDYDVLATRIDVNGKVIDANPIEIAAGPRTQALPDVAGDDKGFVVVWQGLQGEETAYRGFAARVSTEGQVGRAVETGVTPQPRVAWNGSFFLAAGGGAGTFAGTVRSVRLNADGQPVGKPETVIGGTKNAAFSISAAPGDGWLVISHRSMPDPWGWGGPGAIRAARVNSEGKLVNQEAAKEPAGVNRQLDSWLDLGQAKKSGGTWPWGPNACASDGKHVIVVWQRHHLTGEKFTNFENCDLIAARVDGFQSLDPEGIPIAVSDAEERSPALAADRHGGLLLVYERHAANGRASVTARVLRVE
ncbi:MAG: hypothetical protein WD768_17665 [Phycisphaeraceae bacterium]